MRWMQAQSECVNVPVLFPLFFFFFRMAEHLLYLGTDTYGLIMEQLKMLSFSIDSGVSQLDIQQEQNKPKKTLK